MTHKEVDFVDRTVEKVRFSIPSQPKATRVAAYARVSNGKDAMLHSLSAQVSYYSNLIQSHAGWIYVGVYTDEALTGTKESRTDFQRLLTDCRNGLIDLVIAKSISRFARNTVTLLCTVRELKNLGIDVFFEEQNIHTMSAEGELMLTILASYAQEESRSASENQKWRVRKSFENGELMNLRFLYGYRISNGKVEIDPEQSKVIREIFKLAIAGDSLSSIADGLNKRGVSGALGGKWTSERIRCILSNEKFIGDALLQKHYRNNHIEKKKMTNNGELPMYYAEGTHDAIIDKDTFEQAQTVLAAITAKTKHRPKPQTSAFTGLITCEYCGSRYKRMTNYGKKAWNCTTVLKGNASMCCAKKVPDDILTRLTSEVLGTETLDRDTVMRAITQIFAGNGYVVFCLTDGRKIKKEWQYPSRSESWTEEMKTAASRRAIEQRRKK